MQETRESHAGSDLWLEKRKALEGYSKAFQKNPGGVLLSHAVAHAVSSAMRSLTAVFGMGTGRTSALRPPETCLSSDGAEQRDSFTAVELSIEYG